MKNQNSGLVLSALLRLFAAVFLFAASSPVWAAPAPEPWDFWMQYNPDNTEVVDHSIWQELLDQHVATDTDNINKVDYAGLTAAKRELLNSYLAQLVEIDPRRLNRNEQFAYWINLYNALTIEVVLRYPNKKSILRMGKKFFSIGPWDDQLLTIAGQPISLNDIEHRILRPIWQDHRIHYAVNCASIGCPNLSKQAYTSASLEAQLAQAEAEYTNHPRGISIKGRKVQLSSIYKWYRTDFGATEQEVLAHLSQRNSALAETELARLKVSYDYDWKLNRQN